MVSNYKCEIIVPFYNEEKNFIEFTKRLEGLDLNICTFIFVDNGSSDNSISFLKDNLPDSLIISNSENLGYSKGLNRGIELALDQGCEYVLITNNDVVLHPQIINEGVKLFKNSENIGYMGGKVYEFGPEKRFQYAGGRLEDSVSRGTSELDKGQYEEVKDFDYMDDVCILVYSEMIKSIGSYDEDFFFDFVSI